MRIRVAFPLGLLLACLAGAAFAATATTKGKAAPAKGAPAKATSPTPAATPTLLNGKPDAGFIADTVVLCRVGPRTTRVSDFVRLYFASYIEDRPDADSAGRVRFLDNIVAKEVLGLLAQEVNKPFQFEQRAVMRETEQRALSNALYRKAVIESLHVSDAEIAREYESFARELKIRHMNLPDLATAQRLRLDLLRGRTTWHQAYDRYSLSKAGDKLPDGELGWMVRGGATLDMSRKVFRLPPGGISEPIEQPSGWDLVQIEEERPGKPPALSAVRNYLEGQLTAEKTDGREQAVRDLVRKDLKMVYDTAAVVYASSKFFPVQSTSRDENGVADIHFNTILPEFTPQDTSRVLARYRDGMMTIGRFYHLYSDIQPLMRPSVHTPELMRAQIEGFVFEPYLAQIARERGMDKDSMVVATIAQKREELMVDALYSDSVSAHISVDPQVRRKYYQDHLSAFVTYAQVRFAAMWAESKEAAEKYRTRLKAGEKAEDILRADSLLGIDRGSIQTRAENDHGPYQKMLFEELRPGQITVEGPDKQGHYSVIQMLEFMPGRQLSYEESAGYIDDSMQNLESERLLKALVGRHRKRWAIYERPDLVMQVRLVDPTL